MLQPEGYFCISGEPPTIRAGCCQQNGLTVFDTLDGDMMKLPRISNGRVCPGPFTSPGTPDWPVTAPVSSMLQWPGQKASAWLRI